MEVFFHGQLEMHGVATIYRGERAHTTPILATFLMVDMYIITISMIRTIHKLDGHAVGSGLDHRHGLIPP